MCNPTVLLIYSYKCIVIVGKLRTIESFLLSPFPIQGQGRKSEKAMKRQISNGNALKRRFLKIPRIFEVRGTPK